MAKLYQQSSSCRPSASTDAYILSIHPLFNDSLAVLSSADEILLLNHSRSLHSARLSRIPDPGKGLTCTAVDDDPARVLFSGGSDNVVSVFDIRSAAQRVSTLPIGKSVTALACRGNDVAVGTAVELKQHQADLTVWDFRQPKTRRWQNNENHNDDITAVNFHPTKPHLLLSGGDDGLVSLFDTTIQEEDDSLVQAFNHGPIHKAGFVDHSAIYALSADQNLAIHPIFDLDLDHDHESDSKPDPSPLLLGDMRPLVPCEYVIDLFHVGDDFVLATGSHSKSQIDLVNMRAGHDPDTLNKTVLPNAHGNEIVRTIYVNNTANIASPTIFTGGEDGYIRAWHAGTAAADSQYDQAENEEVEEKGKDSSSSSSSSSSKKKSKQAQHSNPRKTSSVDARYKPY